MSDPAKARELAQTMVDLGTAAGVNTRALITAMDVPLGLTAGNALEVEESVEVLAGGGPADVVELTILLAREMLEVSGITSLMDPADALKNGAAMSVWRKMISLQGGDPDAKLPVAKESEVVLAERDGVITRMDALGVGVAAWRLGAGRSRQGETVQAGAGIRMHAKPGEIVKKGQPVFTLYTDESDRFERAHEALAGVLAIEDEGSAINRLPLIIERISAQ
jgi:thymidine phosphorylase